MNYYASTNLGHDVPELHVFPSIRDRNDWVNSSIPASDEWYCEVGPRETLTARAAEGWARAWGFGSVVIHQYKHVQPPDWLTALVSPMHEQERTPDHLWDICYFF